MDKVCGILYDQNGIKVKVEKSFHPFDNDNTWFTVFYQGEEYLSKIHASIIGLKEDEPRTTFRFDADSGVLYIEVSLQDFDDYKGNNRWVTVKWVYQFDTKARKLDCVKKDKSI